VLEDHFSFFVLYLAIMKQLLKTKKLGKKPQTKQTKKKNCGSTNVLNGVKKRNDLFMDNKEIEECGILSK